MKLIKALKNIGFTQQEAILYIKLCKNGELSGYEAAKLTGISRSNAYASLSSLTDKGYAYLIAGQPTKYIAVPKEELLKNATIQFNSDIKTISNLLEFNIISDEPFITITNNDNIVSKLKNLINASTKRIYISCNESILNMIHTELLYSINKGLKVVILAPLPLESKEASYTYYKISSDDYFKIIVDTSVVLAGTLDQALYSKNTTLISIIKESFINEISVMNNL